MNDRNRILLIINPVSGTHSKQGIDRIIAEALTARGFDVTSRFTSGKGDATRLAREAVGEGFDGVLACGGDGTVNETAQAMIDTGVAMGIIPTGSGNGLARHLNIPVDALSAVDVIAQRRTADCDYGTINGRPFFCTFGIGFDAAVSNRFAEANTRGAMTYVRSAIHEFRDYKTQSYKIVADGEEIDNEAFLVAVCNAGQYGNNAYIAPDASIADGLLDLVVVQKMPRVSIVMLGMELMVGTLSSHRGIIKRKAAHITITPATPSPAHIDGEPIPDIHDTIDICCHKGGLRLFTNENRTEFRPIITPIQSMIRDMGFTLKNIFGPQSI